MPNPYKNKVIYGNTVLIDLTDTTAEVEDVAAGKYFYDKTGARVEGSASSTSVDLFVLGGTTQPSNPEQNTIWVNTSTAVTSYALQHNEPDAPVAGMVWIQTSYFSFVEMDILPDNGVKVYPIAAFQYESGAWVEKEAKSYIDGAWKDWVVTVYNGEADISHWVNGSGSLVTKFVYTSDGFLELSQYSSSSINAGYDIPFDLTNVGTVRFYGYAVSSSGTYRQLGVSSTLIRNNNVASANFPSSWPRTDPLTYVDVDVSGLTGDYYVKVLNVNRKMYLKRVVLIPIGGNI